MKRIIAIIALSSAALTLQACGCDDSSYTPWDGMSDMGDTSWDHISEGTYDPSGDYVPEFPSGTGSIQGIVYSPNPPPGADPSLRKFPISGALVYITDREPSAIPDGVYCHECVEMPETQPHDFSNPDGSFTITNLRGGTYLLVIQKGEFRKVRYIDVVDDVTTTIDEETTTFPNAHHPEAGDTTPSIAVALGSYDDMEDILAKIGLCDLDTESHAVQSTCDHIDFYDNGGGSGEPSFESLLRDPVAIDRYQIIFVPCSVAIDRYQIIFVPCSSSTTDTAIQDSTVAANVRRWVDAGGKWYVADWSYDLLEQVFPDFIDFEGDDASLGSADSASGSFDTVGRAVDTDLRQWLELGISVNPDNVDFIENWDCILALGAVPGTDPDTGEAITIVPDTYCEGPITRSNSCMSGNAPLTLTFPYGCGKVLYTTYHTVGEMSSSHADLHLQEQILVYMILEIGLCTDPVIII
ncbi:MAG: carboxypeptidase regulatory-like domain-containing protein [Deltaproteobacteria bacterium]|nr:carboxypeptidase regulatory-like domain-containing protein [Deltaproteobacteria bacterium]